MRQALLHAQSVIDTVHEPMLILDDNLHVQSASRAFYRVFDVSPEETEGRLIYELGNGQWNVPALRTLLEEVLPQHKAVVNVEVTHVFPRLGLRVMVVNARQLWTEEGDSQLVFVAIEDVTERKRLYDDLVKSNEEMQSFAYTAAHDLRTPLNAALNLCRLLARRVESKLDEQERFMLRSSIESMERLNSLMNDMLTLSQAADAPQQRSWISLHEPLRIALANLEHHINGSGATISVGQLPEVRADRTQMVMVFQNIIGNAIKYRRDEAPCVRIDAVNEGSDWRVSIADNGQGFEPEHQAAIFEPFKRLHGSDIQGSGIGLATCKRIVERSGGRIWAESAPGQGSTFFFTLPAGIRDI